MSAASAWLPGLAALVWGTGAFACAVVAVWLATRRECYGKLCPSLILALVATGVWALAGTLAGPTSPAEALAESVRNLAWLVALYGLFALDGRLRSVHPVRPMLGALAFVSLVQGTSQVLLVVLHPRRELVEVSFHTLVLLRLLIATGGLVLVHNLHVGASRQARLLVRWPAAALLVQWGFDLNYFTISYLAGGSPVTLSALRGLPALLAAMLLAMGARRGSEELHLRPSRAVTFQSISLMLIGAYLLAMVGIAQWLSFWGGDFAASLQMGFVALASLLALVILPSPRIRGWLRVTVAKHLFQHRYDYRVEWLRFTRTIAQGRTSPVSLQERVIRAVADITDSPAGMLLTEGEGGRFELAARWQWPTADVPAEALPLEAVGLFEQRSYIADLDELRQGGNPDEAEAADLMPAWVMAEPRAWAIVPLLHFEHLVGVVVLARPPHVRRLDWEDFDLLRVAGQQLASYLAEQAGQAALAEAGRFDDFNRRMAFVMHDIKNLASQLSLLSRNAELHAENPAFRADMLITLRNSTDKLNALIARLSRYGHTQMEALEPVQADQVAAAVVAQFRARHRVELVEAEPCRIAARRDTLEQVLTHLIQNAIDASPADAPVFVRTAASRLHGEIEVLDSGTGMSPEFVRSRLFKPFDSSKPGGFGIGAYEARELVKAMGGRLDVESREGLGSRFTIRLPLADTAEMIEHLNAAGKKVA